MLGPTFSFTVEADPKPKERRNTSKYHPRSIFQLLGVYCTFACTSTSISTYLYLYVYIPTSWSLQYIYIYICIHTSVYIYIYPCLYINLYSNFMESTLFGAHPGFFWGQGRRCRSAVVSSSEVKACSGYPRPGALGCRHFSYSQRVQLECHSGSRAQEPYVVRFLEPNSMMALKLDPLGV